MNNRFQPENYERMFSGKAEEYFLFSTLFLDYYKKLDVLVTCGKENTWTSRIPQEVKTETLHAGLELYSNRGRFKEYKQNFQDYKQTAQNSFEEITAKKQFSHADTVEVFDLISEFFSYYSKTEFFYVDKAARQKSNDATIAKNLEELGKLKNKGREFLNKIVFEDKSYLRKTIHVLANQFDLSYRDVAFHTQEEALQLFGGHTAEKDKLEDRMRAYAIDSGDSFELDVLSSDQALELINIFEKDDHNRSKIKGAVANKGRAEGQIMIIPPNIREIFDNFEKFLDKMEHGNILVADTTAPELMPACKKASAIITNQGGLMSHAAIVSREMDVPCIVGTGNATEVLETGDTVEVVAENQEGVANIKEKA